MRPNVKRKKGLTFLTFTLTGQAIISTLLLIPIILIGCLDLAIPNELLNTKSSSIESKNQALISNTFDNNKQPNFTRGKFEINEKL